MLYRINYQNFLTYMIDYFTPAELTNICFGIVSSKIRNSGKSTEVSSLLDLTPTPDMIMGYMETQNKDVLYEMYKELIEPKEERKIKGHVSDIKFYIYQSFVKPVLDHYDVCIICDKIEDDYVDCLVKYIKEKFEIEAIDLNVLFTKGKIGPIYLDRKSIHDDCVTMNRNVAKSIFDAKASTRDGRAHLISLMSKKEKLKRLDKLGVTPTRDDDIDKLLLDVWSASMDDDDD